VLALLERLLVLVKVQQQELVREELLVMVIELAITELIIEVTQDL
jgi:hypothetical protein